jgi:filamentous hemagglutinin
VVSGQLSVTGNTTVNGLTLLANVNSSLTSTGFITSVLGFSGPSISVTGNVVGGNVTTAGQVSATGNITAGNVYTAGSVTASGNVVAANFVGGGAGTPQLISNTSLILGAATVVAVFGAPFRMASLTTTERNALTAVNGDMIYNSTLNKFQGYENGAWANII